MMVPVACSSSRVDERHGLSTLIYWQTLSNAAVTIDFSRAGLFSASPRRLLRALDL